MKILIITPEHCLKGQIVIEEISSYYSSNEDVRFSVLANNIGKEGEIQKFCKKKNIPYFTASEPHLTHNVALAHEFDICIACAWAWTISKEFIQNCNLILNCHSGFLPDYKGAYVWCHQWANCESSGGATVHYLTEEIDLGDIILKKKFDISIKDSPDDILEKVSYISAELLFEIIAKIMNDEELPREVQKGGRYFKRIDPTSWTYKIHRFVNFIFYSFGSKYRWYTPYLDII